MRSLNSRSTWYNQYTNLTSILGITFLLRLNTIRHECNCFNTTTKFKKKNWFRTKLTWKLRSNENSRARLFLNAFLPLLYFYFIRIYSKLMTHLCFPLQFFYRIFVLFFFVATSIDFAIDVFNGNHLQQHTIKWVARGFFLSF